MDVGNEETEFTRDLLTIARAAPASRPGAYAAGSPVPPHLRERALVLLSRFASRETVGALVDLFRGDAETYVRAAAAEAVGRIGIDPEGSALAAFASSVFPPRALRDERLLAAIAAAVGDLCRFSGPPLSEAGVSVLISLAADERPPAVRERARAELSSLVVR